jgi:hypothetical protein
MMICFVAADYPKNIRSKAIANCSKEIETETTIPLPFGGY